MRAAAAYWRRHHYFWFHEEGRAFAMRMQETGFCAGLKWILAVTAAQSDVLPASRISCYPMRDLPTLRVKWLEKCESLSQLTIFTSARVIAAVRRLFFIDLALTIHAVAHAGQCCAPRFRIRFAAFVAKLGACTVTEIFAGAVHRILYG
jgi:hypothetical protein